MIGPGALLDNILLPEACKIVVYSRLKLLFGIIILVSYIAFSMEKAMTGTSEIGWDRLELIF